MTADTAPAWPDRVWLHKSTSGQDDVWTDTPNGLDSPAYVREAAVTAREAAAAVAMREACADWHEAQASRLERSSAKNGTIPKEWILHHRSDASSIRALPLPPPEVADVLAREQEEAEAPIPSNG